MHYDYKTRGTCSQQISFDIEDNKVKNIQFFGGCNGNTQGVSRLCEGKSPEEIISLLKGIRCGFKTTSCPDQLATAVMQAIAK